MLGRGVGDVSPDPKTQIRWGFGTALLALLLILVLAFVPDPFFRQRVYATTLDDVEGVGPGVQVYFRGAPIGEVRSVDLNPESRTFAIRMGLTRKWRASQCSFATVASANPFTAPRIEIVALETAAAQCPAARLASNCEALPIAEMDGPVIVGCRRPADLFQTAAVAVGEAANVARTANEMAQRLQSMLQGEGGDSPIDMAMIARDATSTLAALNSLSVQLDRSFTPGKGDIALTLSNVRRATGEVDMAALNGILRETRTLVAQNQESVAGLLAEGRSSASEARAMLEGANASLVATSANLDRISDNLGTLTERLADDPTFAIRGQKFRDPPAPGGTK